MKRLSARVLANRRNARNSTGPRSSAGKARSAQNARSHGLSIPVDLVPELVGKAEDLARAIAGPEASAYRLAQARAMAEAEIDLWRIRETKVVLLLDPRAPPMQRSSVAVMRRLRAFIEVDPLLEPSSDEDWSSLIEEHASTPSSWNAFDEPLESVRAVNPERLDKVLPKLKRLDRYEQRARAKRHKAFVAFLAAGREEPTRDLPIPAALDQEGL